MRQDQRRSGSRNCALQIDVPELPSRSIVGVRDSVQGGAATWTRDLFFLCSVLSDWWLPTMGNESLRYAMLAAMTGVALGSVAFWLSANPYAVHVDADHSENSG